MSAADGIAQAFVNQGSDICFGVPGGGPNLELVGAFRRRGMRFVLAHGETSACIMASAYGHIRGHVAPAVVTRGPGAASAVNGAAQATLDRFPLALFTDTVPTAHANRVPHQRIDQRAMFEPVSKVSSTVGANSTSEQVSDLVQQAQSSPQGAVHLNYDSTAQFMKVEPSSRHDVSSNNDASSQRGASSNNGVSQDPLAATRLVSESVNPVVICGLDATRGGIELRNALIEFGAPVLTTYQAIGVVPTEHDVCAGLFTNGESERRLLEQADLVIAVGLDPVEPIPAPWGYDAPVLSFASHPTVDAYMPIEVEIVGDVAELAQQYLRGEIHWTPRAGGSYRELVRTELLPTDSSDRFGAIAVVKGALESVACPRNVTVDAGAHFLAIMPFWRVDEPKRLLISNGLATMGFAVPAAIGMALARPGEAVLALVGDGGLGMTLAELETIVRLDLPITVLVFNDSALSLIEIKQQADDGSGDEAVRYTEVDFAKVADGLGVASQAVTTEVGLRRALAEPWPGPRLIDARIDPGDYRHLIRVTRG